MTEDKYGIRAARTVLMKKQAVVELCASDHYFLMMPDHPKDTLGHARCPYCMSIGLDAARKTIEEFEEGTRTPGMAAQGL